MTKRMLIDASHAEETRVVVLDGTRLEEFDLEAATKRPLKGNIYLAKVVRVEPSLQAAFVEYGGNRHGFLAFSEIHPDYYQIPVADRQRLIEMQAAEAREEEESEEREAALADALEAAAEATARGGDLARRGHGHRSPRPRRHEATTVEAAAGRGGITTEAAPIEATPAEATFTEAARRPAPAEPAATEAPLVEASRPRRGRPARLRPSPGHRDRATTAPTRSGPRTPRPARRTPPPPRPSAARARRRCRANAASRRASCATTRSRR